jgi:hypothetical protein
MQRIKWTWQQDYYNSKTDKNKNIPCSLLQGTVSFWTKQFIFIEATNTCVLTNIDTFFHNGHLLYKIYHNSVAPMMYREN